ncbi:Alpha-D-kanosaminyltransferase [Anatilimnocola aggregata]|uniref:Alpha-D-kanosaminyltransferase n=1 Tax=Anatilimnocola aggregata TaxID=2528021 RepID=A0A517YAB4_9BACT|nr:glycosyltransferase family 4 protein [Anatilimnocola aggregata]QDU27131.1 Alpha-D-kanosaminyltransferase [Anatilimnocola aggregata]
MKVLQFVADGSPGGGTTHVRQIVRGLCGQHEVALLTQRDSFLSHHAADMSVKLFEGDFFQGPLSRVNPRCVMQVRNALRRFQPDVIHCHGGRAAFFRSFLLDNIPTVYTAHGLHYSKKRNIAARTLGRWGERLACRHVDHAIYVCKHDAMLAKSDHLLSPRTPVSVIYPSIAPHSLQRQSRNTAQPTIGFIGRLVPQKDPQAFVEIVERLPEVRAVLGGGGELEPQIRAAAISRGLDSRMEMLGELSPAGVQESLSRIDILVMTSRWEGLPALLLEAMYLGVPVVSTAVGGIAEVVEHGQTGLLSRSGNCDEMADLVRRLIDNPQEAQQIASRAREQLTAQFLEPAMVASITNVYRQVLDRRSVSSPATPKELPI